MTNKNENRLLEEIKASTQTLTFNVLKDTLKREIKVQELDQDVLKTLGLFTTDGNYNITAELLADTNNLPQSGVDIAKFGKDINQIERREIITNCSVLTQYDQAMYLFEQYYHYESIQGFKRKTIERIPTQAFRESLANALVHRDLSIRAKISIAMFNDRIEIISPGGLPQGVTKEEYLNNPVLMNLFYRLKIIQTFDNDFRRIKQAYAHEVVRPSFSFTANSISIKLPTIDTNPMKVSEDEKIVFDFLSSHGLTQRGQIDDFTGFHKAKTIRILNKLIEKELVKKEGAGPSTLYSINE